MKSAHRSFACSTQIVPAQNAIHLYEHAEANHGIQASMKPDEPLAWAEMAPSAA
jgi:hypothetical protein